jgi:hypothetical protein
MGGSIPQAEVNPKLETAFPDRVYNQTPVKEKLACPTKPSTPNFLRHTGKSGGTSSNLSRAAMLAPNMAGHCSNNVPKI